MTYLLHQAVISAAEVAEITGEHERTVQRKARTGQYPAHKMRGKTGAWLFDRAAIEQLLEDRKAS